MELWRLGIWFTGGCYLHWVVEGLVLTFCCILLCLQFDDSFCDGIGLCLLFTMLVPTGSALETEYCLVE